MNRILSLFFSSFLSVLSHAVFDHVANVTRVQIPAGEKWTELKVATTLDQFRKQQALNKGPSFNTIAGIRDITRLTLIALTALTQQRGVIWPKK